MAKQKILFVTPSLQSFVKNDINLLSNRFNVVVNTYDWRKKNLAPLFILLQFLSIIRTLPAVKFTIISFGGYWAFFPCLLGKLFGKPTYIILHGTDCASIPELNYGSLRIPLLKWVCKKSYQWATALFPVSKSLEYTKTDFFSKDAEIKNGFRHHFPRLTTTSFTIPNGFDPEYWKPEEQTQREENAFLAVFSAVQFVLKGGDLICEIAQRFPQCQFRIVGMDKPEGMEKLSSNVSFLGKLDRKTLRSYYSRSGFYFQLSVFEGFGCALCEAMLCGCIPIGSKVNEIPEIIGDAGLILPFRNIDLLEKLMQNALDLGNKPELRQISRARVISKYSLENRKKLLFSLLPK